jgi:hypothetical protein
MLSSSPKATWSVVAAGIILGSFGRSAIADSCVRQTEATAKSGDGRYVVTARVDDDLDKWGFVCEDTKEGKTWRGTLQGVKRHAYLTILVAGDGKHFAVFDPSASHRRKDRLLIYRREGKLLKSFAVEDVLNEKELREVGQTISHIRWIRYDGESRRACWLDNDGNTVAFKTKAGRIVRISMPQAKVLQPVKEDLGLREYLLEDLLSTHAKAKENCYVSFGSKSGSSDPPKEFLERFKDRPYHVKPISAYPKPVGMEPHPKKNPDTGIPDGKYTVEIEQWVDENTAKVRAELWRNGLWARGCRMTVERRDGKWRRVEGPFEIWAS